MGQVGNLRRIVNPPSARVCAAIFPLWYAERTVEEGAVTPQPRNRGLESFAGVMSRWVPDAITAGAFLTLVTVALALVMGNPLSRVLDAYHQGLWMLLPFTMQMTLILVLSLALAATPIFRRAIARLARIPNTRNQFIVLAFVSCRSYLVCSTGVSATPSTP